MSWITADEIKNMVVGFHNVHIYSKGDPTPLQRVGFFTTDHEKQFFAEQLEIALSEHKLYFADDSDFISQEPQVVKDLFIEQCRVYREKICVGAGTNPKVTKSYTGKSPGCPDDVCIAVQMALTFMNRTLKNPEYKEFMRTRGQHGHTL